MKKSSVEKKLQQLCTSRIFVKTNLFLN